MRARPKLEDYDMVEIYDTDLEIWAEEAEQEIEELEDDDKEWDIENSRLVSENVKQAKEIKELKGLLNKICDLEGFNDVNQNNKDCYYDGAFELKQEILKALK